MTEENKNKSEVIDLRIYLKTVWSRKKLFIKVWVVTVILASIYIFPIPRTYVSELSLAPELSGQIDGGGLASLAGSFGIDLENLQTTDAFYPELYPELIATNDFITDLFDVRVKSIDGEIDTDYYTYLTKHQKGTFYKIPFNWVKKQIRNLLAPPETRSAGGEGGKRFNPFMLSEETDKVVEMVRSLISCDVDKKNSVITISVIDQDPLICATMADSVQVRLQDFITAYRTSKARIDMSYYRALADSARWEYQQAMERYSEYVDAHQNTILQSYLSERDELENLVAMKLNAYTAMNTQFEAAKARVQERTPAFTTLKSSSVPLKPKGPKRVIFILAMLVLSTLGTLTYLFKNEVVAQFTRLR